MPISAPDLFGHSAPSHDKQCRARKLARANPENNMGRKKPPIVTGFAAFNVVYQDGTLSSHRKIPLAELEGADDEEDAAKAIIEAQDRKIAALSGKTRGPIKTIARSQ
jgi:hypothetical protein